jgi:hypothetical protein
VRKRNSEGKTCTTKGVNQEERSRRRLDCITTSCDVSTVHAAQEIISTGNGIEQLFLSSQVCHTRRKQNNLNKENEKRFQNEFHHRFMAKPETSQFSRCCSSCLSLSLFYNSGQEKKEEEEAGVNKCQLFFYLN